MKGKLESNRQGLTLHLDEEIHTCIDEFRSIQGIEGTYNTGRYETSFTIGQMFEEDDVIQNIEEKLGVTIERI